MVYVCKPKKISIYVNTKRKTMSQIKNETGCTAIINGGLFSMSTFKPVCHLKVDGKVITADKWKYFGLAWNTNELNMVTDYDNFSNYICCLSIVRDGKKEKINCDGSALGGSRQRTAFGVFEDGRVWMYAVKSPAKTPEQLQEIAIKAGVKHALMLDGGGSTQGASPTGTVTSSRIVHNYICVWADDEQDDTPSKEQPEMTETQLRNKVVSIMQGWIGRNESNGTHKAIIDIYNAHKPLARGYKVQYTDEWCATTVSAAFIQAGLTDIAPTECSCSKMIDLHKKLGQWKENDEYKPSPGDIIMYDWEDTGKGDNQGIPNHTGIVEKVVGNTITVIEGNKSESVARRTIEVNGRYIRGYCVPNYKSKSNTGSGGTVSVKVPVLKRGSKGDSVRVLQLLLNGLGYNCGSVDASFGANTLAAVKSFQKKNGLAVDGSVGTATWTALLN